MRSGLNCYLGNLLTALGLAFVLSSRGNADCPTKSNNPVLFAPNGTYHYCFDSTISNYPGMGLSINAAIATWNQAIPLAANIQILSAGSQDVCDWLWKADSGVNPFVPGFVANTILDVDLNIKRTTFWLGNSSWDTAADDFETAIFKVAMHEEGHVFGLSDQEHQTQGLSVMNYVSGVNDTNNWDPITVPGCDIEGVTNSYSGTVRTSLSAEYLLREGSGTIAHDNSGNGFDATLVSGYEPVWTTLGLQFDDMNEADGVQMPDAVLGTDHTSVVGFTIEFWVNVDAESGDNTYSASFSNSGISLQQGRLFDNENTRLGVWINGETTGTGIVHMFSGNWSYGVWEQVAVVRSNDGSTVTTYLNGLFDTSAGVDNNVPVSLDVTPGDIIVSAGPKIIGATPINFDDPSFTGVMGEMRIYSTALTGDQILANFNARKSVYGL